MRIFLQQWISTMSPILIGRRPALPVSKRLRTSSDFTTEFTTDARGITWTYVALRAGNGAKYSEKHTKTDLFRLKFTNPHDEADHWKSVGKSRVFGHREAKIDEFTTDLQQLTKKSSEKKTLPAMVVFFLCRTLNKAPSEGEAFFRAWTTIPFIFLPRIYQFLLWKPGKI